MNPRKKIITIVYAINLLALFFINLPIDFIPGLGLAIMYIVGPFSGALLLYLFFNHKMGVTGEEYSNVFPSIKYFIRIVIMFVLFMIARTITINIIDKSMGGLAAVMGYGFILLVFLPIILITGIILADLLITQKL